MASSSQYDIYHTCYLLYAQSSQRVNAYPGIIQDANSDLKIHAAVINRCYVPSTCIVFSVLTTVLGILHGNRPSSFISDVSSTRAFECNILPALIHMTSFLALCNTVHPLLYWLPLVRFCFFSLWAVWNWTKKKQIGCVYADIAGWLCLGFLAGLVNSTGLGRSRSVGISRQSLYWLSCRRSRSYDQYSVLFVTG